MIPAIRGFMVTHSESLFADWETDAARVATDEERLREEFRDDPEQTEILKAVIAGLDERMRQTTRSASTELLTSLWQPPVQQNNLGLRLIFDNIRRLDENELRRLDSRNSESEKRAIAALLTIGLASALAVVMVVVAVVVIMRDLRNRRHASEELERARIAAEAASVAKSVFLANMSHELRTPLTSIMGYADLLLDPGMTTGRRHEFLQTMRRSSQQLLTLINDILDVSKIEAGKMTVEHIECRLLDVFADVDSLMRARAQEKGITLSICYQTPAPMRVRTDPTRLRQILLNLVGNAVKFTDAGSARVLVSCLDQPPQNAVLPAQAGNGQPASQGTSYPVLIVEVADTGIGISREQLARIFEPFTQGDVSTTRRFGGTGLGLSISRRLAAMLGGSLAIQSELGKGSTFILTLPVQPIPGSEVVQAGDVQRIAANSGRAAEPVQKNLGARVLLAEDGLENREVITLHLRNAGCEVIAAEDGRQAIETAMTASRSQSPFDVILMDMQMPVMDGYTATAELRQSGYTGPIIALTAHAMPEDRERCLRVGCDEYAPKPVEIPHLLAMIARFTGKTGTITVAEKIASDPVLRGLTRRFCEGLPETLSQMKRSLDEKAWAELAAAAHKLAGTGGAYGFADITRQAKVLERLAQAPQQEQEIRTQLDRLEDACRHALGFLDPKDASPMQTAASSG